MGMCPAATILIIKTPTTAFTLSVYALTSKNFLAIYYFVNSYDYLSWSEFSWACSSKKRCSATSLSHSPLLWALTHATWLATTVGLSVVNSISLLIRAFSSSVIAYSNSCWFILTVYAYLLSTWCRGIVATRKPGLWSLIYCRHVLAEHMGLDPI